MAEARERAHWVRNLLVEPRVRWRVGEVALTGRGRVVDREQEQELTRTVRRLLEAKYGWGDGLVVELVPDELDLARIV